MKFSLYLHNNSRLNSEKIYFQEKQFHLLQLCLKFGIRKVIHTCLASAGCRQTKLDPGAENMEKYPYFLTLKAQNKICSRQHFNFLFLSFEEKLRLDFSCESSAWQRIHLKHQDLFSLKDNEKIFMNVVCCSRDWRFKS